MSLDSEVPSGNTPLDLDTWEAEAKEMQKALEAPGIYALNCDRILILISELREARETIESYVGIMSRAGGLNPRRVPPQ